MRIGLTDSTVVNMTYFHPKVKGSPLTKVSGPQPSPPPLLAQLLTGMVLELGGDVKEVVDYDGGGFGVDGVPLLSAYWKMLKV